MNNPETAVIVSQEMRRVAPDIDVTDVDLDGDLREQFDIDSMDFLHLITALGKHYGIPIPEADYPKITSFNSLCEYLS